MKKRPPPKIPYARQRASAGVLGKAITRRARSSCELCTSREELRVFELAPFPEEPDEDRALLACGRCRRWLEEATLEPLEAWFLSGAVWHELAAVRLAAGRMLLCAPDPDDPWVTDALEAVRIDPSRAELLEDR